MSTRLPPSDFIYCHIGRGRNQLLIGCMGIFDPKLLDHEIEYIYAWIPHPYDTRIEEKCLHRARDDNR